MGISNLETDLWIDRPNAEEILESMVTSSRTKDALRSLILTGIAIIRGANAIDLCQNVIADYRRYAACHRDYVMQNLDELGREKRLVNFHLWSSAALQIGMNRQVMEILDLMFKSETSVYTSLTFKYLIRPDPQP
jgi:hypothetical protein